VQHAYKDAPNFHGVASHIDKDTLLSYKDAPNYHGVAPHLDKHGLHSYKDALNFQNDVTHFDKDAPHAYKDTPNSYRNLPHLDKDALRPDEDARNFHEDAAHSYGDTTHSHKVFVPAQAGSAGCLHAAALATQGLRRGHGCFRYPQGVVQAIPPAEREPQCPRLTGCERNSPPHNG